MLNFLLVTSGDPATPLIIAGVVAVIGSIQVYMKMNNGDQDVSKSIMMLVGACLFLVAAAVALPKFFGV